MREYWADSDLHLRLTAEEREIYVGLWMLSDDAGWLPGDIEAIGAAILMYVDRAPRLLLINGTLATLAHLGKVEAFQCGCLHLRVIEHYPRPGRKNVEHRERHAKHGDAPAQDSKAFESNRNLTNPLPVPTLPYPTKGPLNVVESSRKRPPSPRQIVLAWLLDHDVSLPAGWVNTTLNELVRVYGSDAILALWSTAPPDVRTSKHYVQYAERNLAPDGRVKTKGLGPSQKEVDDAFRS